MENIKYVYILSGISVRKLSDAEVERNFEIFQKEFGINHKLTFEYYQTFIKDFYKHPIDISISREDIAYFYDEKTAIDRAKHNIADYNDGGINNYAMIERLPVNRAYPVTCSDLKYIYFKYNGRTEGYSEIKPSEDEMVKYIDKKYNLFSPFEEN